MTKLSWGTAGKRYYEAGIDRGVLYVDVSNGVAWNGLISVSESASGGEATPYYLDGLKFLNLASAEEYTATIQAFSSPPEFNVCDGVTSIANGLFATHQPRKPFGLCYRTKLGNDVDGIDHGYKIHLVYNALSAPSERSNSTISDSSDPIEFSWEITTTPPLFSAYKPTAHLVIDSRLTSSARLSVIEDILYGTDTLPSRLPSPQELIGIFNDPLIGVAIGDAFMGGYYAGIIDTTVGNILAADYLQTGLRYALIVSPKSLESTSLAYKTSGTTTPNTSLTRWNGLVASNAMVGSTFPAGNYTNFLSYPSDGASKWYLPSMDELELLYRNFKPTTDANLVEARYATDFPGTVAGDGENMSSAPQRGAYTSGAPIQTMLSSFQVGGSQALDGTGFYYISSTENNSIYSWAQTMLSGATTIVNATVAKRVRPVRRLLL